MYHVDVNKLNGKIAERNTTKEALADAIGINREHFLPPFENFYAYNS